MGRARPNPRTTRRQPVGLAVGEARLRGESSRQRFRRLDPLVLESVTGALKMPSQQLRVIL